MRAVTRRGAARGARAEAVSSAWRRRDPREAWPLVEGKAVAGVTMLRDPQTGRIYDVERVLRPEDLGQFCTHLRGSSAGWCMALGGARRDIGG
jgi:hypothetical protein